MRKSVILLGAGYSIKEGIDLGLWDKIREQENWSINYAFMTMPYLPKREIWVDIAFFKDNAEALQKLQEQGVIMITRNHHKYANIRDKLIIYDSTRELDKYYGQEAIQKNLLYYGRMGLSGMFALSLAVAERFEEIFLLGYDFGTSSLDKNQTHYYQGQLKVISTGMGRPIVYRNPNNTLKDEIKDFEVYKRETNIKIWNVSLNSNIPYFEKISYVDFFSKLDS